MVFETESKSHPDDPEVGPALIDPALEWDRFVELASENARSFPAKAEILDLTDPQFWAHDLIASRTMQQETQEIVPLLDKDALWGPLTELADLSDTLERLEKGSTLEISELVAIRGWLYAMDSWTQIPRETLHGELFRKDLALLPEPSQPLRILERILTPQGDLSEKASPGLARLFSEIRSLKREIATQMDSLMKSYSQKGLLQGDFTDVRDGRYVLPVRISHQNEVDGIIYEASVSRQTVFVEPREVRDLNNRLTQRQNELHHEVDLILRAASEALRSYLDEIQDGMEILVHWDCVYAKACMGRRYSGKTIQVTEERVFKLTQTAHPLLWWTLPVDAIIRNDIDFSTPTRAFLITGPNTGGKTVLLKTLGLAGMCARTGFPFPAGDSPTVPFFDFFFIDVGDSQSIERHLSSFSGHVVRFCQILNGLTDQSLILLDELNSATDPEEGAALGRAFLETLMNRSAMIVSTTHDPYLKALAVSDSRIGVASMAFNESSRLPTFRLTWGVPGRSRALETAERLGVPGEVIHLARSYLSQGHLEFEKTLQKLESDLETAARARKEAVAAREEALRLKDEWISKTDASVSNMMEKVRQRLRRVIEQAQDEVRATVRRLDESKSRKEVDHARGKLNETLTSAAQSLDRALSEEAPEIAENLSSYAASQNAPAPEPVRVKIEKGCVVRVRKWKSTGTVLDVAAGKIKVAMGNLQVTLTPDEVEFVSQGAAKSSAKLSVSSSAETHLPGTLDVRGMTLEEAMSVIETYLDRVFRARLYQEVTLVHGLATGTLREGTHRLLSKLPYIRGFRDGGPGHGGAGATIVEFDFA